VQAEQALVALLRASSALGALVPDNRIFAHHLPQNPTMPSITVSKISGVSESLMGDDSGDVDARFQVSCFDDDYAGVLAIKEAVRGALQRNMSSSTIQDIYVENDLDLPFDEDPRQYHRMLDFRVWYRESV
jgi:hypothetical protein